MEQKNIRIGKIINAHGIKGELVLLPLTDNNKRFRKLKQALLELPGGRYEEVEVISAREHKSNILVMLKGIEDRTQAERLKNIYLCVKPEDAVKPKGAYFIHELIGLEVFQGDVSYGKIINVVQNSSVDLYEVDGDFGEFYLPALKTVVKNIDLDQKRMDVEIPDGLLD
ncbi:MAG: 16S rRNA processing protein RimM [Peptococcaceae bacterium]|nr:16S rRNA processing protein RimM [Peptococcaceae bacterium]